MTTVLNVDKNQTGKSLKRYYWLAFVIGGMVVGFLGCLVYSHLKKSEYGFLSNAAGNPKTDKPIVQTALTVEQPPASSAFLGIEIMSVDSVIAQQLSLPTECGVLVTSVIDGSPAQKAGLQRSDCLLSLNNIPVEDVDGFRNIMAQLNPGDDARIIYVRDGQKDIVYTTLANSSAVLETAQEPGDSEWGVSLAVLNIGWDTQQLT